MLFISATAASINAFFASVMLSMCPPPDPILAQQAAAWQVVGIYQSAQNEAVNCTNIGFERCYHMAEDYALIRAEDWEQYARSIVRGSGEGRN